MILNAMTGKSLIDLASYTQSRAENLSFEYCKFNFQILMIEDMSTVSEIYFKCTVHEAFYKMLCKTP